jgi:hypothetical protein
MGAGEVEMMKPNEYSDSDFNMRRAFYEKTVRNGNKKTARKPDGNRSYTTRAGRPGQTKTKS